MPGPAVQLLGQVVQNQSSSESEASSDTDARLSDMPW